MKIALTLFAFLISMTSCIGQHKKVEHLNPKKQILFVCEHGAARSVIASAYFNKMADSLKLNYESIYRGTDPDSTLTHGIKKGLNMDNFDINGWMPELVTEKDIKNAYKVFTFDCVVPNPKNYSIIAEQWNGIPAISKDYEIARNAILEKVRGLIKQIQDIQKTK
jgi:arsenate reductase (thioredoxin)